MHDYTTGHIICCKQCMSVPSYSYLNSLVAIKRILRYLKGTMHLELVFIPLLITVISFINADWASCPNDHRSTSGYCTFLENNLISWSSSKQKTVSRSSADSEYRGLANATTKIIWILVMLTKLGYSFPLYFCFVTILVPPTLHRILFYISAPSISRLTNILFKNVL